MLGLVTGSSGSTMDDNVWEQAECLVPLPSLPTGIDSGVGGDGIWQQMIIQHRRQ